MKTKFLLTGGCAACLVHAGCYNNPKTSLKKPGEGPVSITSGPAVGPGSTPGGSTAGPQPSEGKATPSSPEKH
jgi:hypothetical protein